MIRRIAILACAVLLLGAGFFTTTAHAQSAPTGSQQIWCGLWVGASLQASDTAFNQCIAALKRGQVPSTPAESSASGTGSTSAPIDSSQSYVALGDSVAAGLGLPQSANATSQDVQCGRSPAAYPNLVAAQLNLQLTNLACSGATAGDLVTQEHMSGQNPSAQLDSAFANGTPKLITLTVGANDAHWADFIRNCYNSDCTGNASTLAANTLLRTMQAKLAFALQNIQSRTDDTSSAQPQVRITGYYNPISSQCISTRVTAAEIAWLTKETAALNQTLRDVASRYQFATFVPISFAGHDLCSRDPWVQGLSDPAPLHPTARGQLQIANTVLRSL
jgi:lysophospholipase L1-like esterase